MIRIDPNDGAPIYRQVIDQVKMLVVTGQLQPGDQLESVSQLAARLKVNPMTISKAFGVLVQEGVADRRRGVGLFVCDVEKKQADQARDEVLTQALDQAAGLVVQIDVAEEDAVELFRQHIKRYKKKLRSASK